MLAQHRRHVAEARFENRDVADRLESVLAQNRAQHHVDGAAGAVGHGNIALHIGDAVDRSILQDEELVRIAAGRTVLEHVGDNAQIGHACVEHRRRQRREAEADEIDLVGGERGDLRRRALEVRHIEDIGLALVAQDILGPDRHQRHVRAARHPANPQMHRIGGSHARAHGDRSGEHAKFHIHPVPPLSSCPALCRAPTSFFCAKDVDGRDKPGHDDVMTDRAP
jgi:hypothetical protein